jgi:DNA repair and recombination protein RAD52
MTFTPDQKQALEAPLSRANVKERKQGGRQVSYIEAWVVIAEANRIFGYDQWARETTFIQCVTDMPREIGEAKAPGFGVTYVCKVRVVVDGVTREGCGAGHGIDRDHGLAHESAIKEAETDAMKRALMTFGNPFGLALYDKTQSHVADENDIVYARFVQDTKDIIDAFAPADHVKLLQWWNSDEQKKARRDFNLAPDDLAVMKRMVSAKLPQGKEPSNG